jgi:hypothetical protein
MVTNDQQPMVIPQEPVTMTELKAMAERGFGDLVKSVVDVDRELIALDAELHADLESALLDHGSSQRHLWGINLYPELSGEDFLEFDSMINIRPSEGHLSRGVEDADIRSRIAAVVAKWILR